jgi:hypothetical protein
MSGMASVSRHNVKSRRGPDWLAVRRKHARPLQLHRQSAGESEQQKSENHTQAFHEDKVALPNLKKIGCQPILMSVSD